MVPMLRRPPERTLLPCGASQKSEAKLKKAARLVAPVREIAMKPASDAELPDKEHESAERRGLQINSSPKDGKARQVNHDKENARKSDIKAARHTILHCSEDTSGQLESTASNCSNAEFLGPM